VKVAGLLLPLKERPIASVYFDLPKFAELPDFIDEAGENLHQTAFEW
jgi:hypothetical protein